jgi:phenylalanyl-tRNA synthetase alpha chain
LLVDENVSFADLKGTLTAFVHQMFDPQTRLRFRPSFFPVYRTQRRSGYSLRDLPRRGMPGVQANRVAGDSRLGHGAPGCSGKRRLRHGALTGFAFGMGVERIAMLKYGIDDIRKNFENDPLPRFFTTILRQHGGA